MTIDVSLIANPVTIAGKVVDGDDPCALWQALYNYKLSALGGGAVEEFELRSPVTTRRVRYGRQNLADLDAELSRLQAACEAKTGVRKRTRFAMRGTFRPY